MPVVGVRPRVRLGLGDLLKVVVDALKFGDVRLEHRVRDLDRLVVGHFGKVREERLHLILRRVGIHLPDLRVLAFERLAERIGQRLRRRIGQALLEFLKLRHRRLRHVRDARVQVDELFLDDRLHLGDRPARRLPKTRHDPFVQVRLERADEKLLLGSRLGQRLRIRVEQAQADRHRDDDHQGAPRPPQIDLLPDALQFVYVFLGRLRVHDPPCLRTIPGSLVESRGPSADGGSLAAKRFLVLHGRPFFVFSRVASRKAHPTCSASESQGHDANLGRPFP